MSSLHIRLRVALALAGTVLVALPASADASTTPPPIAFEKARQYPNGAYFAGGWSETSMVTADFNNDHRPDVINTDYFNFITGAPILQLNLGGGVFESPGHRLSSKMVGSGALAAGDFDGDGNQDLILSKTIRVEIWRGDGTGNFTKGANYGIFTAGQEDMSVVDVNSDGTLDVVVLTRYGVEVLLGRGDATFDRVGPSFVLPTGVLASGIDEAQFNGDGKPDILMSTANGEAIQLLGDGQGGFRRGTSGITGFLLGTALAADFNEDGYDDAVVLPEINVIRNAVVFLSDGHGGWAGPGKFYDGGLGPASGEIADFNRDGHLDVIASDTVGGQAVILAGRGDGTFVQAGKFKLSFSVQTPVVADFDGDGRTDIAGVGFGENLSPKSTLSVLRNIS